MRYELTGSRVYGPHSEDSDLDIIMFREDHEELEEWLGTMGIAIIRTELQAKEEYSGYYFYMGSIKVNIIHVEDEVGMDAWAYATTMMKKIVPIEDHELRVAAFAGFRDAFYKKG